MAVMDAAIFEALWRHTAQVNMQNQIMRGFQEYFATCLCFYRCLILVTINHFPPK